MSASPTTSNQAEHYDALVTSAGARARREVMLDHDSYQRFFKRRGEFDDAFVALVKRLAAREPDYTLARSILGGDFVFPEEIMAARPGVIYTQEQIAALAEAIPNEITLRWCKANGYAVIAPPLQALSLLDIRALEAELFYSKTGGWYSEEREAFARDEKTSSGWHLRRKTPVPDSTNENWGERNKRLASVEFVPNAAEMSWFITTFYKVRGVRLFETVYVRTSSLDSAGFRVILRFFDAKGLDVNDDWDDKRVGTLALASGRQF